MVYSLCITTYIWTVFMMKRVLSAVLTLVLIATLFGCAKKAPQQPATTTETTTEKTTAAIPTYNPLTGEEDFNQKAVGVRPVAIVVENQHDARPQWSIGTSDVIVEGEVEGGISRMLWLYADYTKLPEKIGPIRSARPSFVRFSEFYDAFFIHWGGSHNNQDYVGGYGVIKRDYVKHLDGMKGGKLFGRDNTRRVSSEHRGILHGKEVPAAIKEKGWRTWLKRKRFSWFKFNDTILPAGWEEAKVVNCKFSSRTDTRKFNYTEKDGLYHTVDWKTDVAFQNIIILLDKTKYITVPYKGATTTYLNYLYEGGSGYYISNGTRIDITWQVKNNILKIRTADGTKKQKINRGKTYIGLASSNNGGTITFN